MNILICESKQELVGAHITRLQKVFYPSTFDYAQDGKGALLKIKSSGYTYDLILSNHNLPEVTGLEVYQHTRDEGIEVPFILCSNQDETPDIEEIEDEDFFCLTRPYESTNLKKVIDTVTSSFC